MVINLKYIAEISSITSILTTDNMMMLKNKDEVKVEN